MIKYALACEHGHAFEGWFGSSTDYDDQAARNLLQCPLCASHAVDQSAALGFHFLDDRFVPLRLTELQ